MNKNIPIAFIDDDDTIYESENFVNFKLEEKDKEIERLQMAVKDTKENADAIIIEQQEEIERLNNIIKEVRDTLNNKRTIMTTKLLNGEYCDYEELLYQIDEEIRKILDKDNK